MSMSNAFETELPSAFEHCDLRKGHLPLVVVGSVSGGASGHLASSNVDAEI